MTRETLLKVEQSLLVLLNSHGCSNSGRVARNAFRFILFDGIGRGNPEQLSGTARRQALGLVRGTCHLPAGFSAAPALLCERGHVPRRRVFDSASQVAEDDEQSRSRAD